MDQITLPLSPSEAYQRLNELVRQSEYERLSEEEIQELKMLKEMYRDALSDFEVEFY